MEGEQTWNICAHSKTAAIASGVLLSLRLAKEVVEVVVVSPFALASRDHDEETKNSRAVEQSRYHKHVTRSKSNLL